MAIMDCYSLKNFPCGNCFECSMRINHNIKLTKGRIPQEYYVGFVLYSTLIIFLLGIGVVIF